eukprot:m.8701 g.8701  ORF g.8701 m.8701 type:complete len:179 (-) comp5277_c0_seq1:101-637(-)
MRATGDLHQFVVTGRKLPTESLPVPPLYKMTIFAPSKAVAKSRYWYFMSMLYKVKKASGEIVAVSEIFDKHPTRIKNFGIWLRYNSRSGTHNMYREYRDLTASAAVTACYRDMAARHRTRAHSIHIIRVDVIPAAKTRRVHVQQFHDSKIKFPLPHRVDKATTHKPTFTAKRPTTYFG